TCMAALTGATADRRFASVISCSHQRSDRSTTTRHNKANGAAAESAPGAGASSGGVGVGVHPAGAAVLAVPGSTTLPGVCVHERMSKLPSDCGRGKDGGADGGTGPRGDR